MTKREMVEFLKPFEDDIEIIIQKDAEGNEFSPLAELRCAYYTPTNSWSGECSDEEGDYPVVILEPVN